VGALEEGDDPPCGAGGSGDCAFPIDAHSPAVTSQIEKGTTRDTRIVRTAERALRLISAIRLDPEPDCCTLFNPSAKRPLFSAPSFPFRRQDSTIGSARTNLRDFKGGSFRPSILIGDYLSLR
jgi:hypothetical protein